MTMTQPSVRIPWSWFADRGLDVQRDGLDVLKHIVGSVNGHAVVLEDGASMRIFLPGTLLFTDTQIMPGWKVVVRGTYRSDPRDPGLLLDWNTSCNPATGRCHRLMDAAGKPLYPSWPTTPSPTTITWAGPVYMDPAPARPSDEKESETVTTVTISDGFLVQTQNTFRQRVTASQGDALPAQGEPYPHLDYADAPPMRDRPKQPHPCTCDTQTLLSQGCKCGGV